MSLKKEALSSKGSRYRNCRGKSMRWLKRQTSKLRRRLWRIYGESAPIYVRGGYAD